MKTKTVYSITNKEYFLGVFTEGKLDLQGARVIADVASVPYKATFATVDKDGKFAPGSLWSKNYAINEHQMVPLYDQPKPEKYTLHFYKITDKKGNVWKGVVEDPSDTIQVYGLDTDSYFESEAYRLSTWASDQGFKFQQVERLSSNAT